MRDVRDERRQAPAPAPAPAPPPPAAIPRAVSDASSVASGGGAPESPSIRHAKHPDEKKEKEDPGTGVGSSSSKDADADAAKAAAKAAKEARKAAHLAARGEGGEAPPKKPALTRAERRAQQEAQKAAKEERRRAERGGPDLAKKGGHQGGGGRRDGDAASESSKAGGAARDSGSGLGDSKLAGDGSAAADGGIAAKGGSLSSAANDPDDPHAGGPSARQAQRAERARLAASAKRGARPGGGARFADRFSHLRSRRRLVDLGDFSPHEPAAERANNSGSAFDPDASASNPASRSHAAGQTLSVTDPHPAVTALARRYADGTVSGGSARAAALLATLKEVISDFDPPAGAKYAHALTARVNAVVHVVNTARPMAASMGAAVKSLKTFLARASEDAEFEGDAGSAMGSSGAGATMSSSPRAKTLKHLEYFEQEKIVRAGDAIADYGAAEIADGDVVLTHGASRNALRVLTRAKTALGRDFLVAVVGGRPRVGESLRTLKALLRAGIDCAYCDFTGAAHALAPRREGGLGATKVLVGAACVTANGAIASRLGTATLAALAKERGVPVYVVAETCKFQDRIQLDAASANELGDPRDLTRVSDLTKGGLGELSEPMRGAAAGGPAGDDAAGEGSGSGGRLAALNLEYDLSPAGFVRAIVCESGLVTPADVPSFLR